MKTKSVFALSLSSLLAGSLAGADDDVSLGTDSSFDHHLAAPANGVELGIATGYTQGVGAVGNGMQRLEDIARAGGAVELDALYRINPTFAVGVYGTLAKYSTADGIADQTDVLGATAGIQAVAHLRPERSMDPWVSLGTGWRGLWLSPPSGKNTSVQGLELARLQLGVDYRVNEDVAIAPVISGSLNLFLSEDSPMTSTYTEVVDKQVNFIGFAGLAGRFDFGGKR